MRAILFLILKWAIAVLFSVFCWAETYCQKRWDGGGGDGLWATAANWLDDTVPSAADDVLLDNSQHAGSYIVTLPITSVSVHSIRIAPGSGSVIRLILPPTNLFIPGLAVTGAAGISIGQGGEFINSSGASPGTAIVVSDSIHILNGGRFVHNSSNGHASYVMKLSRAPGTEQGTFEFNVPGTASYTVSIAGRIYGNLELSAFAAGGTKTYVSNGSTNCTVRGNFTVNTGVNYSLDFAGIFQVKGHLVNNANLNIASASNTNIVQLLGNLSNAGNITETANGFPVIELAGSMPQSVGGSGNILNSITFRLNKSGEATLLHPLSLPYKLQLLNGKINTSSAALLTLQANCTIEADSNSAHTFINGPLAKVGMANTAHFLFPVGKAGRQRWFAMAEPSGGCIVEYFHMNPSVWGTALGSGIFRISALEYWVVQPLTPVNAKLELSFDNVNSGGVTDLASLRAAQWTGSFWEDIGQTSTTGSAGAAGSVISTPRNLSDGNTYYFTLASAEQHHNPLPLRGFDLQVQVTEKGHRFSWHIPHARSIQYFELEYSARPDSFAVKRRLSLTVRPDARFVWEEIGPNPTGYYRIKAMERSGAFYYSNIRVLPSQNGMINSVMLYPTVARAHITLNIDASQPCRQTVVIIDRMGRVAAKFPLEIAAGKQRISLPVYGLAAGYYRVFGLSSPFPTNPLIFIKP